MSSGLLALFLMRNLRFSNLYFSVVCPFSMDVFKIFSLSLVLSKLIMMCLAMIFLCLLCLGLIELLGPVDFWLFFKINF